MAYVSKKGKSALAPSGGGGGGYLNPQRIPTGSSARYALLSETPLEYWEVWVEDSEGTLNPKTGKVVCRTFRFTQEPTDDDIQAELGTQWVRRMNYDKTEIDPVKFCLASRIYNHDTERVEILSSDKPSVNQAWDEACDKVQSEDDYSSILECDFVLDKTGKGLDTRYAIRSAPRKKGTTEIIQGAKEASDAEGFDIARLLMNLDPFKEAK